GAREPEPDHEGERRLVALAEELAVAAQAAPPRVAVLDLELPQAAVVGSSPEDSVLLFTRGLVETLDRSETQAIAGHALAVALNGNAGLGATSLGLYQALSTVLLVLNPARWGELAHVVRWVAPGGKAGDAEDAARLLDESLFQARAGGVLATVRMAAIFVSYFFFRPVVGAVLQTRRLHADADTVRLTRDPTALARALKKLEASGAAPPGGVHLRHLWVVGGPYRPAAGAREDEPDEDGSVMIGRAPAHDPHPSVPRRLRHLAALGARLGGRVPTADPSALEGLRHALATESPFQIAFAAAAFVLIAAVIVLPVTMLFVTACGVSTLVAGLLLWAISALLL
ncbi:MAG: M48 family metalloprotease, partial [Thermoanaerobaculia bacterium]